MNRISEIMKNEIQKSNICDDPNVKGGIAVLIASIPSVGGIINTFMSTRSQEIFNKRIILLCEEIQAQLEYIDINKIDKNFLESEEFFDVCYKIFSSSKKTRQKEKIKMYAKIFKETLIRGFNQNLDYVDQILSVIEVLSLNDLIVLKYLYDNKDKINDSVYAINEKFWSYLTIEGMDGGDVAYSINRLFNYGFLSERYGAVLSYSGGYYRLTIFADKFVEYLNILD